MLALAQEDHADRARLQARGDAVELARKADQLVRLDAAQPAHPGHPLGDGDDRPHLGHGELGAGGLQDAGERVQDLGPGVLEIARLGGHSAAASPPSGRGPESSAASRRSIPSR